MKVLSLCDYTGNMLKPWAEAGHECTAVDIKHNGFSTRDGVDYFGASVQEYKSFTEDEYDIIFAFPPCTHTAVFQADTHSSVVMGGHGVRPEFVAAM